MASLMSIIQQGLIFSLTATAVFLTSRVIQKDDLTVEGSFGLGGAITAVMLSAEISSPLACIMAMMGGALAGACTGVLHARMTMNHLMAGLVTTTACFSFSLALASANKIVAEETTIFRIIADSNPLISETMILALVAFLVIFLVRLILRSEIGLLFYCTGANPHLLIHLGKSSASYNIAGFMLANAITALSGSLFVQWSGVFSITGNIGTLITGLASVMLAELVSAQFGFIVIAAAIIYQSIFMFTLELGILPVYNNLIKALVMILLMLLAVSSRSSRKTTC